MEGRRLDPHRQVAQLRSERDRHRREMREVGRRPGPVAATPVAGRRVGEAEADGHRPHPQTRDAELERRPDHLDRVQAPRVHEVGQEGVGPSAGRAAASPHPDPVLAVVAQPARIARPADQPHSAARTNLDRNEDAPAGGRVLLDGQAARPYDCQGC